MPENPRWIDVRELKEQAWFGLAAKDRGVGWLVLLDVLSPATEQHPVQVAQRCEAYTALLKAPGSPVLSPETASPSFVAQAKTHRQIEKDVKRVELAPGEEVRYTRAMRAFAKQHPVIGYVQGMCEIYQVFYDVLSAEVSGEAAEALGYFCFVKVVGRTLDHFSSGQQGIERVIEEIDRLLQRHAQSLYRYLTGIGVETKYFAYNWMSTFLFREFARHQQVMDAHFSLGVSEFTRFNTSFALAIVIFFRDQLINQPFEDVLSLLQHISDYPWTPGQIEQLLAVAYVVYSGGELPVK